MRLTLAVYIHAVFIQPLQLRRKLGINERVGTAKPRLFSEKFADARKQRPVFHLVRGQNGKCVIAGRRIDGGKIALPSVNGLGIRRAAALDLAQAANDFANGKSFAALTVGIVRQQYSIISKKIVRRSERLPCAKRIPMLAVRRGNPCSVSPSRFTSSKYRAICSSVYAESARSIKSEYCSFT